MNILHTEVMMIMLSLFYEGDRIVIKDNNIFNSGEEFIGFVGFFDKVEDMSENVS